MPTNTTDEDAVETTCEPVATAPATPLTRTYVLDIARTINSAAIGTAAFIEQHALQGRCRPAFLDAWRKWHGGWAAWYAGAERLPVNLVDAHRTVERQGELLGQWRQGALAEIGATQVGAVVAPEPPAKEKSRADTIVGSMPTWAKVGIGIGLVWGTYVGSQWLIRHWSGKAETTVAPAGAQ